MRKSDCTPERWEAFVSYQREYNRANRDSINARRRANRLRDLERQREMSNIRNRRWSQTEKGRVSAVATQARRRASYRGGIDKEWVSILRRDPCSYCGGPGGEVDHIVPVALGGDNSNENLTASCRTCNASKSNRPLVAWMAQAA